MITQAQAVFYTLDNSKQDVIIAASASWKDLEMCVKAPLVLMGNDFFHVAPMFTAIHLYTVRAVTWISDQSVHLAKMCIKTPLVSMGNDKL